VGVTVLVSLSQKMMLLLIPRLHMSRRNTPTTKITKGKILWQGLSGEGIKDTRRLRLKTLQGLMTTMLIEKEN